MGLWMTEQWFVSCHITGCSERLGPFDSQREAISAAYLVADNRITAADEDDEWLILDGEAGQRLSITFCPRHRKTPAATACRAFFAKRWVDGR